MRKYVRLVPVEASGTAMGGGVAAGLILSLILHLFNAPLWFAAVIAGSFLLFAVLGSATSEDRLIAEAATQWANSLPDDVVISFMVHSPEAERRLQQAMSNQGPDPEIWGDDGDE